jgi:hypothetical protein
MTQGVLYLPSRRLGYRQKQEESLDISVITVEIYS